MSVGKSRAVAEAEDGQVARLEEAALWFAQLEDGVADREKFEAWRAVPENALAFARVSDSADWIDNQKHRIPDRVIDDAFVKGSGRRNLLLAGISIVGTGLVGSGVYSLINPPKAVASTGVGDKTSIALPDGGRLEINTDSKVRWRFDGKQRRIWLDKGEIGLTVPLDERPLILMRGTQRATLTEGQINARIDSDRFVVLAVKGVCVVADADHASAPLERVSAGSTITLGKAAPSVRSLSADEIEATTAWQNGEIVFNGVELGQAVAEYNRYLKRKIVVADPKANSIRVGGRFTTRDPSQFLSAVGSSFSLTVHDDGKSNIRVGG